MNSEEKISFPERRHSRLSEEKLMAYISGKLPSAEQHEVELWMAEEGMESDAIEGLSQNKIKKTNFAVKKINTRLRKTLTGRKRRNKLIITDYFFWLSVIIILALTILGFILLKMTLIK